MAINITAVLMKTPLLDNDGLLTREWARAFGADVDAVLGASKLTTVDVIPKVTTAGTLGPSSLTDDGTKVTAAGDIDATGVFRHAGVPGITDTLTLPGGGIAVIEGGIVTAKTDPTTTAISSQAVVTGSRALGTVYQNTGSGPMYVLATLQCQPVAGAGEAQALTDSATPPTTVVAATYENNGTSKQHLGFWVLPGNYYKIAVVTNAVTLSIWTEWT